MGQPPVVARRRRRIGLGLRSRVTAAFGVGALLVSTALAAITYETARQYLLNERQSTAVHQTYVNAALVRTSVPSLSPPQVNQFLSSLDTVPGSRSVLLQRGQWHVASLTVSQDALPPGLKRSVIGGAPTFQRFDLYGAPNLAIGLPVPEINAYYFEVFSLAELEGTLRVLAIIVAVAALVTTLAGTVVGRWASGRALRPLADVAGVAAAIAGGRLDTRLETADDADLAALASSFNRMADRLQERIEREARFASNVSHELRSPLTTLLTSVGVLEARRAELPERSRRALDLLAADLHRFQRMIEDLLEISRFDAGAAELSLDVVRADELVRRAVDACSDGGVHVEVGKGVAERTVEVDKRRIERVVANLVENAQLYAGGPTGIAVETADGHIRVIIEDTGPGVPEADRQRVFDRFWRGSTAGQRSAGDGSGLGLSLVAEHVRLHGGKVWVESRPGGGARFVVELPATSP